jgi:hypothetical protein
MRILVTGGGGISRIRSGLDASGERPPCSGVGYRILWGWTFKAFLEEGRPAPLTKYAVSKVRAEN